jgi:hypothetical protein
MSFSDRNICTKLAFKLRAAAKENDVTRSVIRSSKASDKEIALQLRDQQLLHDRNIVDIEEAGGILWQIYDLKPVNVVAATYLSPDTQIRIRDLSEVKFKGKKDSMLQAMDSDKEFYKFNCDLYTKYAANVDAFESYGKRFANGTLDKEEKAVELLTFVELCSQVKTIPFKKSSPTFSF